ncbi:alkaline phosphatase D family protein [Hyalangium versicolor]|uniref:alkaline phosphatase D family protein n=1 Tax=Hyalangium versicolor TaxID=2861190 RepID=UPI001CCB18C4|nr:alkaline phosphatase D family protein [Hyalangium versicolor]
MSQKMHRRTILQSIVAVAATTAFGCSDDETTVDTQSDKSRAYFPQSVASGEPRPNSVVLWTRAINPAQAGDITLSLDVSTDENFGSFVLQQQGLTAQATHDNAIKIKVTNLQPRTTYYYRFIHENGGDKFVSPVGRTKTAPSATDDVPVKFVFASCQDYVGRYYNSWARLLQLDTDLDFIAFLGDYIYETTGDPAFQSTNTLRGIQFTEPTTALVQHSGIFQYGAAASLSNYRDIYKTVRADPIIQKLHERYPFIVMWDDHEFSNDCWGSNATYENGRRTERQDERRRNAEQAFFEFLPIEANPSGASQGVIDVNSEPKYPDTHIYRDFEFGKHVRFIVTDYRTYRPDHLVPEDAFPGTVAIDAPTLAATGYADAFNSDLFSYIDVDAPEYAQVKGALRLGYIALAQQSGLSSDEATAKADIWVKGNLALAYVNQLLAAAGAPASGLVVSPANKPRGVAFVHMGKLGLFDQRGVRNIVVKDTYDLYSYVRYLATQTASENVLGTAQEAWFKDKLKATNTWKVIVSSVSFSSLVLDLSNKTDIPDTSLRQRYYFTTDQWDGFPTKKKELLTYLKNNVSNPLVISGDIHAAFASVEEGVPTLTAPAISSSAIQEEAGTAVMGAGFSEGSAIYRYIAVDTDKTLKEANPALAVNKTDSHGFVVLEVKADEAVATYHFIPSTEVHKDYSRRTAEELRGQFTTQTVHVRNGAIISG